MALFAFYDDKVHELESAGQFFMAAVALALALETAVLTYRLVEFGDENGRELQIPDSVNMSELIEAANEIDVLNAPISIPSHVRDDAQPPKHVAKEVVKLLRRSENSETLFIPPVRSSTPTILEHSHATICKNLKTCTNLCCIV